MPRSSTPSGAVAALEGAAGARATRAPTGERARLEAALARALERRRAAGAAARALAMPLARASADLAARFAAGGRLLALGSGATASDARHVSVEFVHPVIVGKRALPAVALAGDGPDAFARPLRRLAREGDAALAIALDGGDAALAGGLAAARDAGLLTLALVGGAAGERIPRSGVDHLLHVPGADPLGAKEDFVCAYHLLWELAQVLLEARASEATEVASARQGEAHVEPDEKAQRSAVSSLYPFLDAGPVDEEALLADAARSAGAKLAESIRLRAAAIESHGAALLDCAHRLADALRAGAEISVFGNGGSATDAQSLAHLWLDPPRGRPQRARSLVDDVGVVTALANDVGLAVVFARQLATFARPGDVAIGLSTSGDSENVLRGLAEARRRRLLTVGLAGYDGGALARGGLDFLFVVPSHSVHRIQECQTALCHVLWELVQAALEPDGGPPCAS